MKYKHAIMVKNKPQLSEDKTTSALATNILKMMHSRIPSVFERESDIEKSTKADLLKMLDKPDLTEEDVCLLMTISPLE